MEISISTQSEAVQFMYGKYLAKSYVVNRKYQRKLVWSLAEKQAFIDSLRRQYSVPLFLFAEGFGEDQDKFEIIDGLQRMNAITSFIENEFPIEVEGKYYYFDLDTLADTREAKDKHKLTQNEPALERSICTRIVNYPLSISIIRADQKNIETVFRRINSFGRQLSEQEIRMAGAVGLFPDLVRKISSKIRGDVSSSDRMNLNDMRNISLSDKELPYGINVDQIFWVKNNIISKENIRTSRDEEIISQILAYILFGKDTKPNKNTIDSLYQYERGNGKSDNIDDAINKYGFEKLVKDFMAVTELFNELCRCKGNTTFRNLICGDSKIHGIYKFYQVLFLSVFELYINEGKTKVNIGKLYDSFKGIAKREFRYGEGGPEWTADLRNSKINAIKGIIHCAFEKDSNRDVVKENWTLELEGLLTQSRSEGTQYDFKQTCHDLDSGKFSDDLVLKMVKTLTAAANRPNSVGYVILGVADKRASAERYKQFFGVDYVETPNNSFFVTGIQAEVNKYHKTLDDYIKKIKGVINNAPISDIVKQHIVQNIKVMSYYGNDVVIFSLVSMYEPIAFEDKYYIRSNNDCEEVKGASANIALYNSFTMAMKRTVLNNKPI